MSNDPAFTDFNELIVKFFPANLLETDIFPIIH